MGLLNYYRIGRTVLVHGAPLRIAVETASMNFGATPASDVSVRLILLSRQEKNERSSSRWFEFAAEKVAGRRNIHRLEIVTDEIPAGSHELEIQIGGSETITVAELLWLLPRDRYRRYLLEISREPFASFSPRLEQNVDFVTLVRRLFEEWVEKQAFTKDTPAFEAPSISTYWAAGARLNPEPVRWAMRGFLEELGNLTTFGADDLHLHVRSIQSRVTFSANGVLRYPLSSSVVETTRNRDINPLFLLNARRQLRDFHVEIQIDRNSPTIEMELGFSL